MSSVTPPRRLARRTAVGAAVTTALVGSLLSPAVAQAAQPVDAHDVLAATTAAEREALAAAVELTSPDEVQVADGVDLTSSSAQSVIVVLRQPVAATARALAAASGDTLSAADAKNAVKASQQRFRAYAEANGLAKGIAKTYDAAINAVSLTATGAEISTLLDSADVAAVWPNAVIALDGPETDGESGVTGGGTTYDEVAALHAAGLTGDGVKVGILDTGIDYNHPALQAVFRGGWDAVDEDDDPMETTFADWQASKRAEKYNGSPYYTSHGTHVAGIIAGQDEEFGGRSAWGIAPGAEVYGYRVLGPYGSGYTEDILEGMEHALADGMDVVNMSLGGSYNDHQSPLSIAADNLTLAGVTTVIAAGNDGAYGAATLGSPGTSALALTVGANDSPLTLASTTATVGAASADLRLISQKRAESSVTDLAGKTFPIVDVAAGNSAGYLGVVPTGKIVLIQRGTQTFTDMATYAKSRGAAGAIVINNRETGPIDVYLGESDSYVTMFGVDATQGAAIKAAMAAGATTVTFGDMGTVTTDADKLASFSSRGPANGTTDIKPEITAPGVSVMSSVPTWDIDPRAEVDYSEAYGRKSGTSMATPFVAGLVALMLEDDPSLEPADVKTRLMNTADDLRDESGVFESGAGQVDPRQVIATTTDAQVIDALWVAETHGQSTTIDDVTGALSLGMLPTTEASTVTRTIEITNTGSKAATYTLAVDTAHGAGTADFASSGAEVTVDKSVKISAGSTKKVKVTLSVPAGTATGTYGLFITVSQSGDEALRLPLGYRVDDAAIADFTLLKPVMSTGDDTYDPALKFSAGVETPTRTLDMFLVDPATGEDFGYVGGIDPTLMVDGGRYGPFAWYGDYLPLTGDKDWPISHKAATLEPGHYQVRIIGTDDSGTEFESDVLDFYVDNTAPVFTTNFGTGPLTGADNVNEFPNGQGTFAFSGNVTDGEIDEIRAAGIDVDQSDNSVQFYSVSTTYTAALKTDANGDVATDVKMVPNAVQSHRFLGRDAAGNIAERVETWWFKDTQSYVVGHADKKEARPGDTVTTSLSTNNATQFATMKLEAFFNPRDTENIRAVAQDEFAKYGHVVGEPTVTKLSATTSRWQQNVVFDGETEYTGDDLPLVDILYDVKDTVAAATVGLLTLSTYVTTDAGKSVQMQRVFDTVYTLPDAGILSGGFYAQGLFTAAGQPDADLDHSAVGASATVTSTDGQVVDLEIGADGSLTNFAVPLSADAWKLRVALPGHLAWNADVALSKTGSDGKPAGVTMSFSAPLAAGDVNGDDVIDILDAIAIRDAKGTANRAADINFDGTVDAADLAFVELNFLARNPTADTVPAPQVKHKGVTLDQVLAAFAS